MNTGRTGWCAPSAAAHDGHEPVDVGLTGGQRSDLQLVGRRDALGERRRDVVGLLRQRRGVGCRRRPSASTPTSSLTRAERGAQRPRLPRRRLDDGPRLAQCGQRGVGTGAQLGLVHRAGRCRWRRRSARRRASDRTPAAAGSRSPVATPTTPRRSAGSPRRARCGRPRPGRSPGWRTRRPGATSARSADRRPAGRRSARTPTATGRARRRSPARGRSTVSPRTQAAAAGAAASGRRGPRRASGRDAVRRRRAPRVPASRAPGAVAGPRSATTTRLVTTAPSRGVRVTSGSTGRSWRSRAPAAAAARSRLPAAVWCTASASSTSADGVVACRRRRAARPRAGSGARRSPAAGRAAQPLLRGQHGEQPEPVDHVAGGDRLDRRVEVAGAGLQRRGDPQADDQRRPGRRRSACARSGSRAARRAAGRRRRPRAAAAPRAHAPTTGRGRTRPSAPCDSRPLRSSAARHGVPERRRGDVPEAVGAPDRGRGAGPRPTRSTRRGRRAADRPAARASRAVAKDVNQASRRELNRSSTPRNAHSSSSAGAAASTSSAARNRARPLTGLAGWRDVLVQSALRQAGRHLVVHGDAASRARSAAASARADANCIGSRCGSGSSTRTRSGVRTPRRTKPAAARSSTVSPSDQLRRRRLVQLLHGGEGQQRFEQGDRVLAQVELPAPGVALAGERGDLGDVARAGVALGDERHAERVAVGGRGEVLDPGRPVRRDVQPVGDVVEPRRLPGAQRGQPVRCRPLRRRDHLPPAQLPRHRGALEQLEQHVVDALGRRRRDRGGAPDRAAPPTWTAASRCSGGGSGRASSRGAATAAGARPAARRTAAARAGSSATARTRGSAVAACNRKWSVVASLPCGSSSSDTK